MKNKALAVFCSLAMIVTSAALAGPRNLTNYYDFQFLDCTEFALYPVFKVVADGCREKSKKQTLALPGIEAKFQACMQGQPPESGETCLRSSSPITGTNHCLSLAGDPEALVALRVVADLSSQTAMDVCLSDAVSQIQRGVKHIQATPGPNPPQFDHLVPVTVRYPDQACEYIVEINGYEVRASGCDKSW